MRTACKILLFITASCLLPIAAPTLSQAQSGSEASSVLISLASEVGDDRAGRIAFTFATQGGGEDIYCLDITANEVYPLVTGKGNQEQARWSPDGRKLVYISDELSGRRLRVKNVFEEELKMALSDRELDATAREELAARPGEDITPRGSSPAWPDWSPDGAYLVFRSAGKLGSRGIYIVNADGRNLRQITRTRSAHSTPRWSPRGTEIIYTTKEFWPGWDIVLYDINEKKSTVLTKGVLNYGRPAWHPDGSSFAFSYGTGKETDIWQLDKGERATRPIVQSEGRESEATWIDYGAAMVFSAETEVGSGNYQLYVWDSENSKVHLLAETAGSMRHPDWTRMASVFFLRRRIELATK